MYFNSPVKLKEIINVKINTYKIEKKLKFFRYSKENSLFLKELCENEFSKYLNQEFNITDSLMDNVITLAITSEVSGRIRLESSSDQIKEFPPKLRLEICQYIFELLIKNPTIYNNNQLLDMTIENLISQMYPNILNVLKDLRYKESVFAYINALIKLTQKIIELYSNGLYYGAKKLAYNDSVLDLPFGRDIIEPIIKHLKEKYSDHFPMH